MKPILRQGFFNCKPSSKAVGNKIWSNTKFSAPFSNCNSNSIESEISVTSRIVFLLNLRCPCAIIICISSVIILTINRMLWGRSLSHIRQKILKGIPSLANRNASSAIITKLFISWIMASISHAQPNLIFWDFFRKTMNGKALSGKFVMQAPTAFGVTCPKALASDYFFLPARTTAFPKHKALRIWWNALNNCQPKKCFARKIDKIARIGSSHSRNLHSRFGGGQSPGGASLSFRARLIYKGVRDKNQL